MCRNIKTRIICRHGSIRLRKCLIFAIWRPFCFMQIRRWKTQNPAGEPVFSNSACFSYVQKSCSTLLPQNAPRCLLEAFFQKLYTANACIIGVCFVLYDNTDYIVCRYCKRYRLIKWIFARCQWSTIAVALTKQLICSTWLSKATIFLNFFDFWNANRGYMHMITSLLNVKRTNLWYCRKI